MKTMNLLTGETEADPEVIKVDIFALLLNYFVQTNTLTRY